ncbi:hypothetical protein V7R84_03180 [Arachnia propionica]|uniref:hypothetical protein n=1 Tax=Arachnia propionica TaxID=1750 RepID=UPI0030CBF2F0
MAPSRALVWALWLVHMLHDMAEHLPLNPERLPPEPPSHRLSLPLNTPPLRPHPLLGQPPLIPPNLHPPPHNHSQPHQPKNRHTNQPEDRQAGHRNLAIACAAPVAYAPNNASKYGALSGATCTNA